MPDHSAGAITLSLQPALEHIQKAAQLIDPQKLFDILTIP